MKTVFFENYEKFLDRDDKEINGTDVLQDVSDNTTCIRCWNCKDCKNCYNCVDCENCQNCDDCASCKNCENCQYCENCKDCKNCKNCKNCDRCKNCQYCENCTRCLDCQSCAFVKSHNRCNDIPNLAISACFAGLYDYVCCPRIYPDGSQWIQMGCKLLSREEWEKNPWNNPIEFPDDKSPRSNARVFALKVAFMWLDENKHRITTNQTNQTN